MPDLKEIKKLTKKHFDNLAIMAVSELSRRKNDKNRVNLEKSWKEVDRQVALIPAHNKDRKAWEPNFELPFQANALEILTADADELRFSGTGDFFTCHCELNNDFLNRFQQDVRFLAGDNPDLDVFQATQEAVDSVTQGALMHVHKQYRFKDAFNQLDAEAFKYGTYAAKLNAVKRHTFQNQFGGISRQDSVLPVMVPISIKNFYPDDLDAKALAQGLHLTPMQITVYQQRAGDIKIAAKKGSSNPQEVNGGWIKGNIDDINADRLSDLIELIEVEGDFLIEADGDSVFIPNMIATIAHGKGTNNPSVIRVRENPYPFQSVFFDTYFKNGISVYGTSPLMKGESMQKAAQVAIESVIKVSALQAKPPLHVNGQDPNFLSKGAEIFPGAIFQHITAPQVLGIGDLQGSAAVFAALTAQYEDITGVNRTRAGAQTKSHQTAFAVGTEKTQGRSRTVKFVKGSETGFMTNLMQAELAIMRGSMTDQSIYVKKYEGYVTMSKDAIPENTTLEVKGASTPALEKQELGQQTQAIQAVIQSEGDRVNMGGKPLDLDKLMVLFLGSVFPETDVASMFSDKPPPKQPPEGQGQPQQGGQIPSQGVVS